MELQETATRWKQAMHVMAYWKDTVNKKPTDFYSKFLEGKDQMMHCGIDKCQQAILQ